MKDIVNLDNDTDLFGQEISNKPQINREMFAAGLYTILRDISLKNFAGLFINEVEAATEYVSLCVGERAGQRISLLFTPHRLDTAAKASPISLYRRLTEPSFCSGLARVMILKKDRVKNLLYQSVELGVNGATFINEFPPYVARDLALEYGLSRSSKVLDPCGGWGGRMLGFSTVVDSYTCCEPSTRTAVGLEQVQHFIHAFRSTFRATIHATPFEQTEVGNGFDFALTSPPYYDTEWYAPDEATNSCNRYATFDAWCVGFYTPLVHRTMAALKPGSPFLLNIGSRGYPLSERLKEICAGRYRVEKQKGRLSGIAGYGKEGEGETFYEIRR